MRTGSVVLGNLAVASHASQAAAAEPSEVVTVPQVVLGRTGAKVSRLGIGCAYFQRKHVTPDDVTRDAAPRARAGRELPRHRARSTATPRPASPRRRWARRSRELRDKFFLVTKTEEPTYEGTWKLLKQSMKRMQTDRIDLVHLHNFGDEKHVGRPQARLRRPRARWARCARRRSRASSGSSAPAAISTRPGSTRRSTAARSTS